MILAIRSDKPEAELYALSTTGNECSRVFWQAHRELSNTIFYKLDEVLQAADSSYEQLTGLIVYKGPGSFTGLRIGATVANTLAYSLHVPVVGVNGDNWLATGLESLKAGDNHEIIQLEYGGEANITKPRK